jgi:hypothetical protein
MYDGLHARRNDDDNHGYMVSTTHVLCLFCRCRCVIIIVVVVVWTDIITTENDGR